MLIELQQQYNELQEAIDVFRSVLQNDQELRIFAAWNIPLRCAYKVEDHIRVTASDDRDLVIDSMTDYLLRKNQDPHESLRCPGIIGVSPNTIRMANDLNGLKQDLANRLSKMTNYERNAFHRKQKGVSASQLIRRYEIIVNPEKLRFQWYGGTSISRFTVKSFRDRCLDEIRYIEEEDLIDLSSLPSYPESTEGYRWVKHIRDLNNLPDDEVIAERRPTQPHVRCYVRAGGEAYYAQVSMPLLFDYRDSVPEVKGSLDDYDRNRPPRKPKKSRFEDHPIVVDTSIYRYRSMFREYESDLKNKNLKYRRKIKRDESEFFS